MKEKLYTIELTDALHAGDECMFCWLNRKLERENLEFVLGSSYMESDTRDRTDRQGFCQRHTKMMYQYGNSLGNGWILKSRLEYLRKGLGQQTASCPSGKKGGFLGSFKKTGKSGDSALASWIREQDQGCYICGRMKEIYERMLDTFVYLIRNDEKFREALMKSKGFCLPHFADVLDICEEKMSAEEKNQWISALSELMEQNLERIQKDVDWLIEKYDYRNRDADWRQSEDAVQRSMQKIAGGYPADPPFQCKR